MIDILNLEWPESDRDLNSVTPVLIYLKKKYGITSVTRNIHCGHYYLLKYRPRLLLVSNFAGARINHEVVKSASKMGIKSVSLISEGNVKKEGIDQFLWGWNYDKVLYVDRLLVWSNRSRKLFTEKYPELESKIESTGAPGFDRYRLQKFMKKEDFLIETGNQKYSRIVGIAGWGFDHFFGDYFEKYQSSIRRIYPDDQIQMHREDLFKLQKVYSNLITKNPNVLFILRYHPGTIDFQKSEFFGLDHLENVLKSSNTVNFSYKITDLISVSDIWMGYESTTLMEAWLLNKPTFLINPSTKSFVRENVHKGSPIFDNLEDVQTFMNQIFKDNIPSSFEELEETRHKIITDVIGHFDGRNHRRVGEVIVKILEASENHDKTDFDVKFLAMKEFAKRGIAKTGLIKKFAYYYENRGFYESYLQEYENVIDV